jgi:hypothetical protein
MIVRSRPKAAPTVLPIAVSGFNPQYVPATLNAAFGRIPAIANGWAHLGDDEANSTLRSMYAISSVITVSAIPEPSTYAALAGLIALIAVAWHRRRSA